MNRREALKRSGLFAGVGLTGAAMSTLLQSCQNQARIDWTPVFFTPLQAATMSSIVDVMLPATETPGALDLKVDLFVDLMMSKSLSELDQAHVRQGCEKFVEDCKEKHGRNFSDLSSEEKTTAIEELGNNSNTFNVSVWGSPIGEQAPVDFYRRVRQFALLGYFSSEEVGKNILNYDPIPGEYKGCIPAGDIGNSWTI